MSPRYGSSNISTPVGFSSVAMPATTRVHVGMWHITFAPTNASAWPCSATIAAASCSSKELADGVDALARAPPPRRWPIGSMPRCRMPARREMPEHDAVVAADLDDERIGAAGDAP